MKNNKSLIKHYNFLGFDFDNYDIKIFLTLFLGFIFILLFLLFPYKVFASYDNTKYFNLVFPQSYHDDFIDLKFGSDTDLKDVVDELMSYQNNYRNLSIIFYYNDSGFYRLNVYLSPKDSNNSVNIYGNISGSNLTITNIITFSKGSIRFQFGTTNTGASLIDSVTFSSIKDCLENNNCPTSRPDDSDYTGSISYSNSNSSLSNTSYTIFNYDSTLDYDIVNLNILYYSYTNFTLVQSPNTSYVVRNIKYNDMNLDYYSYFPSYIDYINIPDDPVNPDNPEIDTNVGSWKNYILWFVDNNSVYGVLVNLYILFFISIIGTSFLVFIKLIRKNRW